MFPFSAQADVGQVRKDKMYKGIRAYWKKSFAERKIKYKLRWLPKSKRITIDQYAKRLIKEVVEVTSKPGNTWLTPEKLLGLATTESGLQWWVVRGWKDNLDCGITQIAVKWQEKTYKKRRALCGKLVDSTKLGFQYSMKVLNETKTKHCGWRYKSNSNNFYQCLFNIYNQGYRFLWNKWKYCRFKRGSKQYWGCVFRNRYWLKTMCFSRIYELGRAAKKKYCIKATNLKWIKDAYK